MGNYDSGVQWDSGARWDEPTIVPQPEGNQRMAKVKIGLKDATKAEIIAFGKVLIESLTGSATYPDANVAGLQTLVDTAETNCEMRVMKDVEARNALEAENTSLEELYQGIVGMAAHVDDVSGGDPAKIAESGFETRSEAAPIGELPGPVDFLATPGDMAGEIDLVWAPVSGARAYSMECREDVDGSTWVKAGTSFQSKFTLSGLTPGLGYRVRVAALGTAGQSPWSDESICRAG